MFTIIESAEFGAGCILTVVTFVTREVRLLWKKESSDEWSHEQEDAERVPAQENDSSSITGKGTL